MDQEQIDRQSIERRDARVAVCRECLRAAVGHPRATGSRHPALGHDPRLPLQASCADRAAQQPLVVPEPGLIRSVRAGGIKAVVIPAVTAARIVSSASSSSAGRRMQPSPIRSSEGSSHDTSQIEANGDRWTVAPRHRLASQIDYAVPLGPARGP